MTLGHTVRVCQNGGGGGGEKGRGAATSAIPL